MEPHHSKFSVQQAAEGGPQRKAQRSGFALERRSDGVSELCPVRAKRGIRNPRRRSGPAGIQTLTQILRAGNVLLTSRGTPRKWGPGVSRHWRTKFASAASPGDPLVPFPSLGKEPAPQGGTPCQTARRGRRALQNEESSARRPQAAKLPQNTEKDKPRGAYPQGLSWFKI